MAESQRSVSWVCHFIYISMLLSPQGSFSLYDKDIASPRVILNILLSYYISDCNVQYISQLLYYIHALSRSFSLSPSLSLYLKLSFNPPHRLVPSHLFFRVFNVDQHWPVLAYIATSPQGAVVSVKRTLKELSQQSRRATWANSKQTVTFNDSPPPRSLTPASDPRSGLL